MRMRMDEQRGGGVMMYRQAANAGIGRAHNASRSRAVDAEADAHRARAERLRHVLERSDRDADGLAKGGALAGALDRGDQLGRRVRAVAQADLHEAAELGLRVRVETVAAAEANVPAVGAAGRRAEGGRSCEYASDRTPPLRRAPRARAGGNRRTALASSSRRQSWRPTWLRRRAAPACPGRPGGAPSARRRAGRPRSRRATAAGPEASGTCACRARGGCAVA